MSQYTDPELVDAYGEPFQQRFPVDQLPNPGISYRVVREEWDFSVSPPVRTIIEVELI